MHKNQIKYWYSIFVFVLISIYSFSSLAAKASLALPHSYLIYNRVSNYNSTINNIHIYGLGHDIKQQQTVCNKIETDRSQLKITGRFNYYRMFLKTGVYRSKFITLM